MKKLVVSLSWTRSVRTSGAARSARLKPLQSRTRRVAPAVTREVPAFDQRAEQVRQARHRDAERDGDLLRHQWPVVRDDVLDDVERAGGRLDLARDRVVDH